MLQDVGFNNTCQTLWEDVRSNLLVIIDSRQHVYGKATLLSTVPRELWSHKCTHLQHFNYYELSNSCGLDPCLYNILNWKLPLKLYPPVLTLIPGTPHSKCKIVESRRQRCAGYVEERRRIHAEIWWRNLSGNFHFERSGWEVSTKMNL
jgi:hypothetical protein